jgi:hypothetical protein
LAHNFGGLIRDQLSLLFWACGEAVSWLEPVAEQSCSPQGQQAKEDWIDPPSQGRHTETRLLVCGLWGHLAKP